MKKIYKLFVSNNICSKMELLYGAETAKKEIYIFARNKCRIFIIVLMLSALSSLLYFLVCSKNNNKEIVYLVRNNPGQGPKKTELTVRYRNKEESIPLTVSEKKYTKSELERYATDLEMKLPEIIRNEENSSLDNITSDMNLMTSYEGYPFVISWKSDKPSLISNKGRLNREGIRKIIEEHRNSSDKNKPDYKSGIPVNLCATIEYDDYSEDIYFSVLLNPAPETQEDSFKRKLKEELEATDYESRTEDKRYLPTNVDGVEVTYTVKRRNEEILMIILGIIVAFGLMISKDKEIDKSLEKRRDQLEKDYAGIIEQYALYYCAGMNYRQIWKLICSKYEERLREGGETRFAFEEMIITDRKITEGVSEIIAYEDFAKRCLCVKYRVFVSIVEQSIKKGGDRLDTLLREEVEKARREYTNTVKRDAQELSTKLLIPMLMMLIVVLIIVMVPAFLNFGG